MSNDRTCRIYATTLGTLTTSKTNDLLQAAVCCTLLMNVSEADATS
jgi:hypothetical protein